MKQIANIEILEVEVKVTALDLMIQRVTSVTYLNDWYVNNVFQFVSGELKELKTLEEIIIITESLCMEIYEQEFTFEAYEYVQSELQKLTDN